ncbi:hypothetical protein [Calycomorphotria hydatis]|uniref:Ion channel n=1 Tax=Calycomorphotria hydatis TaxID=2528027 RepID=A0A517T6B4_9PLAN|nr:hypothetical protein [Calycomorphotria hydatis]QDT63910.1 hypothetical protein V22_11380 [Calycomorphotria hydatis]
MFIATAICFLCVLFTVLIHLSVMSSIVRFAMLKIKHLKHWMVASMIFIAIAAHLIEIELFAVGLDLLTWWEDDPAVPRMDMIETTYFSATAYTSLGTERLPLTGQRILIAVEALTGLIMITWTATIKLTLVQRLWTDEKKLKDEPQ